MDGQRSSELLDLLEGLYSDPGISSTARYVCPLAGYYSHAGDHPAAIKILRDHAAVAIGPDEAAAIGYHLAYVLARSASATCVPEIDRLLDALPPGYPSVPALAHTTALRHLTAGDPSAALADACRSLTSDALTPAEAAEVHLTVSAALAALGRPVEAAESRAEASRLAPNHLVLEAATRGYVTVGSLDEGGRRTGWFHEAEAGR
jgi:hypothetical protein